MNKICRRLHRFRVMTSQEKHGVQVICLDILHQASVDIFQNLRDKQRLFEKCSLQEAYLRIQYHVCRIVLANIHRSRFCMFEGCDEAFSAILVDCDRFSDANCRGDAILTSSQIAPIKFTFSTEFIMNIFFVATVCHNLAVRRRAIYALRRYCRREKFWDSFQAAAIAEWLLNEEEKRQHDRQEDGDNQQDRLLLSSLQLFQEDDGLAYRRPEWAQVEVENQQETKDKWLYLGEAAFGSSPPQPNALPAHDPLPKKLCYKVNGPIWPSAAKMIGQTCLFGRVKGPVDLGG